MIDIHLIGNILIAAGIMFIVFGLVSYFGRGDTEAEALLRAYLAAIQEAA